MQLEGMRVQLDQQRVAIEQYKADLQARESMLNEIQAAKDSEREDYMAAVSIAQEAKPEEATPPAVVNIVNPAPAPPEAIPFPVPVGGGDILL
jgi:peptidoglycan hydrolase CwlO-like protein